jgi:hypothetical protein
MKFCVINDFKCNSMRINLKYLIVYIISILIFIVMGCKKEYIYTISDSMKQYFAYRQGSYWIYKNDSTGLLDSTYVTSYYHNPEYNFGNGIKFEVIDFRIHGAFLSESTIQYIECTAKESLMETSNIDTLDHFYSEHYYIYDPSLLLNIKNTNKCVYNSYILYKAIAHENINNTIYNNIVSIKIQSNDSSSTNSDYYQREIYFAKNIGIIRYFEINRIENIHRSYSLLRYKVIQ